MGVNQDQAIHVEVLAESGAETREITEEEEAAEEDEDTMTEEDHETVMVVVAAGNRM